MGWLWFCFSLLGFGTAAIPQKTYIRPLHIENKSDPNTMFYGISQIEIDNDQLYIRGLNATRIKVFNRDLSFAYSIGTRGQGPGEFHSSITAFSVFKGTVWAFEGGEKAICFRGPDLHTEIPLRGIQISTGRSSTGAFACDSDLVLVHAHPKTRKLGVAYAYDGEVIQGVGEIFPVDRDMLLQNPATNDTMWVKGGNHWFAVFEYHPLIQKFDAQLNLVAEYTFDVPAAQEWFSRRDDFINKERFSLPPEMNTDIAYFNEKLWLICYGALIKINPKSGQLEGIWHFFGRGPGFEGTSRLNLYTFDFFDDGQIALGSISDIWGSILWTTNLE